jgi:hypothetical protein
MVELRANGLETEKATKILFFSSDMTQVIAREDSTMM